MKVIIEYDDFALMRIAARRWAKANPDNPNAEAVARAVERNSGGYRWRFTDEEIVQRRMQPPAESAEGNA
jgi:hypothetical protein